MPAKIKNVRNASRVRANIRRRKNKPQPRRQASERAGSPTPQIVADSLFKLNVKPKLWVDIHDSLEPGAVEPALFNLYKDLVQAYNHGAALVHSEKIIYKRSDTCRKSVALLLQKFKDNICPSGFKVNIDDHVIKSQRRRGHHYCIFKPCSFPNHYWHFFEIKKLVLDLYRNNRSLHDVFIIFLKAFIENCKIPTWYGFEMGDAQLVLGEYKEELDAAMDKGIPKDVFERTGYTIEQMNKRAADISATMKEYATGQAFEYYKKIREAPLRKPHVILRALKKFPQQTKLVQFMEKACELMKAPVCLRDFCYERENGTNEGELGFGNQVTIIWDWADHYSATYGNIIEDIGNNFGSIYPIICGRVTPQGCFGLKMENLTNHLDWPNKLSSLHGDFQKITERYTDYQKQRVLI